MLKTMSAAILAAGLLSSAGQASAQVISTGPSFTLKGNLTITQDTTSRVCSVELYVTMDPGGLTGEVRPAYFTPGQIGCGFPMSPRDIPWDVTYVGPGALKITGAGLNTLFGYCDQGQIDLAWNNSPPGSGAASVLIPFPGTTTLPSSPYPSARCYVTGVLVVSSPWPVAVI